MIIYVLGSALNTLHELHPMLRVSSSLMIPCYRWGTWDTMKLRYGPGWGSGFGGLAGEPTSLTIVLECVSDLFTLLLRCADDSAQSCTLLWWYLFCDTFFCLVSKVFVFFYKEFSYVIWLSMKVFRVAFFILRIYLFIFFAIEILE